MMKERYGADKLGFIMAFASIIITITAAFLNASNFVMRIILLIISAAILGYAAFRVFSKNITMRKKELYMLEMAQMRIASLFTKNETQSPEPQEKEQNMPEPKIEPAPMQYKHFKCPQCKKHLKVPEGKGYVKVVCPACGHRFTRHT